MSPRTPRTTHAQRIRWHSRELAWLRAKNAARKLYSDSGWVETCVYPTLTAAQVKTSADLRSGRADHQNGERLAPREKWERRVRSSRRYRWPILRNNSGVSTNGLWGIESKRNRVSNPAALIGSTCAIQRQDQPRRPSSASARTPASRKLARRVSPCRLASRRMSGPTTNGTWANLGG